MSIVISINTTALRLPLNWREIKGVRKVFGRRKWDIPALSQPFALHKIMMLWMTTRSNSSIERRRADLARRAEPRLRFIMLLTVSTCQRCPERQKGISQSRSARQLLNGVSRRRSGGQDRLSWSAMQTMGCKRAASRATRSGLRIGPACQACVFFSPEMCRITSSSLATPMKYQASISTVRWVGLAPVHRLMIMQAMMAQ